MGMLCLSSLLPLPTGLGLRYISAHVVGLVIGANLSEPHTSVTALTELCVCLGPREESPLSGVYECYWLVVSQPWTTYDCVN